MRGLAKATTPLLFILEYMDTIRELYRSFYGRKMYYTESEEIRIGRVRHRWAATCILIPRRTAPVLGIGVSFGIDKTVSSNGRVRGKPQRRGFESRTIPFLFCLNAVKIGASYTGPVMEGKPIRRRLTWKLDKAMILRT